MRWRSSWGTSLEAGRYLFQFPKGSLGFFTNLILLAHYGPGEYERYLLGGKCCRCQWLTTLPPPCADCVEILGAPTSWSPRCLSRPVKGLPYLFVYNRVRREKHNELRVGETLKHWPDVLEKPSQIWQIKQSVIWQILKPGVLWSAFVC